MTVSAGATHTGMKRDHNEDCFQSNPELGLWLVADGVGGHASGEVASAIVKETISVEVGAGTDLLEAVLKAHQAVLNEIDTRDGSNMGSTVVALMLRDDVYDIVWVGDSRAYMYDGKIVQLTQDHNTVSQMLAEGILSVEEAEAHPDKNVLTQSMGVSKNIRIDPGRVTGSLQPGQQIILCSDGLTDELNDQAIADGLAGHAEPENQVNVLINAALKSGGRDNVTVVIVGASKFGLQKGGQAGETTRRLLRIVHGGIDGNRHDGKALLVLGVMAIIVLAWVLLSG